MKNHRMSISFSGQSVNNSVILQKINHFKELCKNTHSQCATFLSVLSPSPKRKRVNVTKKLLYFKNTSISTWAAGVQIPPAALVLRKESFTIRNFPTERTFHNWIISHCKLRRRWWCRLTFLICFWISSENSYLLPFSI